MRVLKEGTRLADRYTLICRIGDGGMAEIWLADDARSEGRVALKFLRPALADESRQRGRFHDEWRIASRLMHAHIVRMFEYHDADAGPYFAMQYLDGPGMAALHAESLPQKLRPFGFLADALRYAHGKGIVHRDIKAGNILFDRRGAPYLIDFGVAARTGAAGDGGGSPVSQSPAQRAGEPVGPADDIYALGVLLHELALGSPPQIPGQPDAAADGLPEDLRSLLADMLQQDAAGRPAAGTVGQRLADAGFLPGLVALAAAHGVPADDTAPVAVQSIQPVRRQAAAPAPARTDDRKVRGLSPMLVGGTLAALVLVFLGVVYLLPDAIEHRPGAETALPARAGDREPRAEGGVAPDAPGTASPEAESTLPEAAAPGIGTAEDEAPAAFSENAGSERSLRAATDEALGDLLSRLERLRYRGIERWGGQEYLDAVDRYAAGDEAYLNKNYAAAGKHYRAASRMLEPFFERIDGVFRQTMEDAKTAFEARDFREAIRLYDLATTITPGNGAAEKGLRRARNLEDVLALTERAEQFERQLELDAAEQALQTALKLDPEWQPAATALSRVQDALVNLHFEQRMTEGFDALVSENFDTARAAFDAAKAIKPDSQQPVDGLLQLDQEVRLARIRDLEATGARQADAEEWEAAVETYQEALAVDSDLQFAKLGLRHASERAALHRQLDEYIEDPDSLSAPQTMQAATKLLLNLSRITPSGPRLEDQKEQLSRLLKRAATPLTVQLRSDNQTDVAIYRVGQLGTFESKQLDLRPGSYIATGSRPGYRDVRLEFRVAPEVDLKPIIVACEEPI